MAETAGREYQEALNALISQINIMKLALEGKHGPNIKKLWS